MGTETLPSAATVAAGLIIKAVDFLTVIAALQGAFVGRNTSGVPTSGQSLGTSLYPWGNVYGTDLIIGGNSIDVSGLTAEPNRIISGKTRSTSGQPAFLAPNGAAATATIEAAATNLELNINGTSVSVTADVAISGLTTAPSSNNTCTINDSRFIDQAESKYFGESDSIYPTITIDNVGSEISSLIGQLIALKTGTSEIMFGTLKNATELTDVKRGYFFNSSNSPLVRETLADNDTLTLMEVGWVFLDDDGITEDISYLTPVVSYDSPGSPATGQYWYDLTNKTWKRYSGADFVVSNKMILGILIMDSSNCIAGRSFDFSNNFKTDNTIDLEIFSDEVIKSSGVENLVNVYGSDIYYTNSKLNFDNTSATDFETGSVAASTRYYLYLTTSGQEKISTERPYDRTGDLRGKYHPYNNWRYIGRAETDSTSDWVSVLSDYYDLKAKKEPQFSSKNLVLEVLSDTTVGLTADEIELINEDGKVLTIYNVSEIFDVTTDIHSGTIKASHYYQLNISANRKDGPITLKMTPILTGTTTSTTAFKLEDTGATFTTDIVSFSEKYRPTARNRTDINETKVTVIDDADTLSVLADNFVSGEDYEIIIPNPINVAEFKANVGKVLSDGSSDLTRVFVYSDTLDREYSEADGDFVVTGTNWTTTRAVAIPYQNTGGSWRMKFNITGSVNSASRNAYSATISGVTFKNISNFIQAISANGRPGVGNNGVNGEAGPNNGIVKINHPSSVTDAYQYSGDVELDSKPTWAD
jgi:hypothetical protein